MKKLALVALIGGSLLAAPAAEAALLSGTFTISGLEDVEVRAGIINWGEVPDDFSTPIGDIRFVTGTGSFDGTFDGTDGTIKDLNLGMQPVGSAFVLADFIENPLVPSWNIQLEYIAPGSGTAAGCTSAPGAVCTPPGSPFTITNNMIGGSGVELAVRGTIFDGSGDPGSPFVGSFTTQFPDMTADEILALLIAQGFVRSSHSGAFTVTAIPEPASLILFGTGLASLAAVRRRRNRK